MRNAPLPMPDDCGSTSVSIICTAIAASTALPHCASIATPESTASGFAAATMSRSLYCVALVVQPDGSSGAVCDAVTCGAVAFGAVVDGVERQAVRTNGKRSATQDDRARRMRLCYVATRRALS